MKRSPDLVREAIAALAERGHTADIDISGRHYKISWVARGRKQMLIVGRSPSDYRASKNSAAQLKRLLRASEEGGRP
jgi:hypothetical protein